MADRCYVVTGGAGFIGSHIAERLLKDGHQVRIVDNLATGKRANIEILTHPHPLTPSPLHGEGEPSKSRGTELKDLHDRLTFHEVSITDKQALVPIFKGAEVVFHLAALPSVPRSVDDPLTTHEYNATGTLNVLLAAKEAGVRRVVYAASSSAYGEIEGEYKVETMTPQPLSPYGVAKLAGEYYCQAFTQVYGLETVCLRYFNVFGSRQDPTSQYAAVIPLFITQMLDGKPAVIHGDGQQSRDFTYVDNVVHGNLLAADAPEASGQVINLATGGRVDLRELVGKINTILGTNIAPVHDNQRTGDIKHSRADIQKARNLLKYEPVVKFDEGLARTVEWYRSRA